MLLLRLILGLLSFCWLADGLDYVQMNDKLTQIVIVWCVYGYSHFLPSFLPSSLYPFRFLHFFLIFLLRSAFSDGDGQLVTSAGQ